MIQFILKGLLRDRNRSLIPVIVVSLGVMLTVVFHSWITGVIGESLDFNAKFSSGHVKIMSRAYSENRNQVPNDLALLGTTELLAGLQDQYPDMEWVPRIRFGGLIDVPDTSGETLAQGPVSGLGIDLFSPGSVEAERFKLNESMVRGNLPDSPGEVLIGEEFSQNLGVNPGDHITLISSTMYGSMSIYNFQVAGTVFFGTRAMDKGAMIADLSDVRLALDMNDATGEILGFFREGYFVTEKALSVKEEFNRLYSDNQDEFSPWMITMREENNLGVLIDYADSMTGILISVFILAMSIVLWNAGLLSGLRRYGEVGLRLAMGEEKGHLFRSLIQESFFIGLAGSILGTTAGLLLAGILQNKGINVGSMMENASIMMPATFHARITPQTWWIGFIPGLFSTVLGTMLSGIGIYKRKTAQLFKELEVA